MTSCYIPNSHLPPSEKRALLRALDAYRQYAEKAQSTYIDPRRRTFDSLKDQTLLQYLSYNSTLEAIESAVTANAAIASAIYQNGCDELSELIEEISASSKWHGSATEFDCSVARSCIRALFRDWSVEGASERKAAHEPILRALGRELGVARDQVHFRVLVPGVGLGRLVHSINQLGISVEGNDVSYHTLLARIYLFANANKESSQQPLYPWALSFSNHISRQDQLQKVMVPDLSLHGQLNFGIPAISSKENSILFSTGGFAETYNTLCYANSFSALVTCYFIDTAPNFVTYMDTAWNVLKPGGLWINIGPLLWNPEENGPAGNEEGDLDEQESWMSSKFDSSQIKPRLELTAEEVILLVTQRGFAMEETSCNVGASSYVGNACSMLQYTYNMAFWVARKM